MIWLKLFFVFFYCTNFITMGQSTKLSKIKLTTRSGFSCGGWALFAQICPLDLQNCCEEQIVSNPDQGFSGGDIIIKDLKRCNNFTMPIPYGNDFQIRFTSYEETMKQTKESFCPLNVELETNDGNKLTANFANTRITETPMTQLIRAYGQYWSSCSDQDNVNDEDEDEDCDYGGDEILDSCESYCNCTSSNSNPRPNPCGDQLHSGGVFDIPPENWKCNFQIKFYTGDDIQPKIKSRNNVRKPRGFRKIDFAKNVNRIRIDGTCCIKIYKSKRYRGENQFLGRGFDNIPNFSTIRSFKYGFCNEF